MERHCYSDEILEQIAFELDCLIGHPSLDGALVNEITL